MMGLASSAVSFYLRNSPGLAVVIRVTRLNRLWGSCAEGSSVMGLPHHRRAYCSRTYTQPQHMHLAFPLTDVPMK